MRWIELVRKVVDRQQTFHTDVSAVECLRLLAERRLQRLLRQSLRDKNRVPDSGLQNAEHA